MWERNLQDLIRGIRANKHDEARFIYSAIEDIRKEVRTEDMELKAAAVLKLAYLEMLGYDMSWASFHVVEVMSSPRFHLKSMGYLAATQSFEQETDVLMLATNLLKKDLTSSKPLDVAVALNGLSHIVTPDLGRDLSRDLIALLTHSRPTIRKRAVLALYKVFMKYPEALEFGMERMKERLEDSDNGVVCATVNVLCELARQNPQAYLPFAPPLFHLLTTSSNNWMLIKIIKLFGLLTPHEPRLVKKLQPPITELISTTPAISLLYECVHTCIIGGMLKGVAGHSLAQTCVTKLAAFLEDSDQNLKYISLLALAKIVPSYPHLVAEYESRILSSIDDPDLSIRMRALDLLSAMANENNLQSIVQQLLAHLVNPNSSDTVSSAVEALAAASSATQQPASFPVQYSSSYRTTLATRILELCSADMYANVSDFEWYVSVLVDLAYVARAPVGATIRDQLMDIVVRVRQVRRFAVQVCMRLLGDETFTRAEKLDTSSVGSDTSSVPEGSGCQDILWAAAWICGEYGGELSDTRKVIPSLLSAVEANLPSSINASYIQCISKVFGSWAVDLASNWDVDDLPELKTTVSSIISGLQKFTSNEDYEVQERAANALQLFNFIKNDLSSYQPKHRSELSNGFADASTSAFDPVGTTEPDYPKSLYLIQPLFSAYELNPVAPEAQASVAIPEDLDLNSWIVPQAKPIAHEPVVHEKKKKKKDKKGKGKEKDAGENATSARKSKKLKSQQDMEEAEARAQAKSRRMEILRDDPYYISDPLPPARHSEDVESIPVVRLDDLPPLNSVEGTPRNVTPTILPSLSRQISKHHIVFTIDRGGEMPPETIKRSVTVPPPSEQKPSPSPIPPRMGTPSLVTLPSPYQEYDEADVAANATTPELIKVKRSKKKKKGDDLGKGKTAKKLASVGDTSSPVTT